MLIEMPPPKSSTPRSSKRNKTGIVRKFIDTYLNIDYVKYLLFDPSALPIVTVFILIAELLINVFVINTVRYTEIDWIAYMQECEGFLNKTTNYAELKGDTGPLVYPAAFVYIYSALYYITGHGANIRIGQYIFAGLYLLQMWLVLRIYAKSRKLPPYALMISAFTSYRIHSIYVLRLFNDPVAIVFLYAALNLFLDRHWTLGSLCFSLGVGVKMNILLFAPALLLFYLTNLGYMKTFIQLTVCALVQLIIGAPFLLTYPVEYLKGSFDLGRIFEHKWTVNYRFLPRELFENKLFHLGLLVIHLLLLAAFARPTYTFFKNYVRLRELQHQLMPQIIKKNMELQKSKKSDKLKKIKTKPKEEPTQTEEEFTPEQQNFLKMFESSLQKRTGLKAPRVGKEESSTAAGGGADEKPVFINFDQCTQLALLPLFLCNFIGVACARSLHYQFYVWYFHSLPYLVWSTEYSLGVRCLLLGLIEFCWNTYPSTNFSSYTLHLCHVMLLVGVGRIMYKTTRQSALVKQNAMRANGGSQPVAKE